MVHDAFGKVSNLLNLPTCREFHQSPKMRQLSRIVVINQWLDLEIERLKIHLGDRTFILRKGRGAMTDEVRLPRKLSEEPEPATPVRPSLQKVIDQVERWANSSGLQPPRTENAKTI